MSKRSQHVLLESLFELPVGAHVTPTRAQYINRDTRKALEAEAGHPFDLEAIVQKKWVNWNTTTEVVPCYTAFGFKLIPLAAIREIK